MNFIGSVCKEESFKLPIMGLLVQKFLNNYQEADNKIKAPNKAKSETC